MPTRERVGLRQRFPQCVAAAAVRGNSGGSKRRHVDGLPSERPNGGVSGARSGVGVEGRGPLGSLQLQVEGERFGIRIDWKPQNPQTHHVTVIFKEDFLKDQRYVLGER
jgi:hypothetical protein